MDGIMMELSEDRATKRDRIRRNKQIFGTALLVGFAAMAVVLHTNAPALPVPTTPIKLDAAQCPINQLPQASVTYLISDTENMSPTQRTTIWQHLAETADRMEQYERLTLSGIVPDDNGNNGGLGKIVTYFSQCKPPASDSAQAVTADARPNRVHAWRGPIRQTFDRVVNQAAKKTASTPLMNALRTVAGNAALKSGGARKLVIISDFLQHSPGVFSHFNPNFPDFDRFAAENGVTAHYENMLSGVTVQAFRLHRSKNPAIYSARVERFWQNFFAFAGVRPITLVALGT